MATPTLLWGGFSLFILAMLALDLGVFHRKAHVIGPREALLWSGVWIGLALLFGLGVALWRGPQTGLEYLTAYLIEKSLSVDNVFVFLAIFASFRVPARYQHKVLFWGIVSALVMRALLIAGGIALLQRFHWVSYPFGLLLAITGLRLALERGRETQPEASPLLRLLRRHLPMTESFEEGRFLVKRAGRYLATPLLLVLIIVEFTDLIFAVDSIPAVLAITVDPFIVWTSNVFAILGLRALYFALAGVMRLFSYLRYGLGAVLVFMGAKMLLSAVYRIPVLLALGVVVGLLVISIAASLLWPRPLEAGTPAGGEV